MRILVLGVIILAALILAAGCTTTPPANTTVTPTRTTASPNTTTVPAGVYTINDSGKTVPLVLNHTLSIRLPENPTTGYSWNASVTEGLQILDTLYTPEPSAANLTGVGGTRNWTVKGVMTGAQRFNAVYIRPWETNVTPIDQFNLTVQVS